MALPVLAVIAGQILSATASSFHTRANSASAYASNSDGSLKLSPVNPPILGATNSSSWDLTIDDSSSGYKQNITGFGAAITDATVAVFNQLDSNTLNQLLKDLLTDAGANFSFMRHTIASSDLSADPAYTYDDNSNNADPNLSSFNLGDRGTSMAKLIAQMQGVNKNLQILGSPWSPPAWMKINKQLDTTTKNNNLNDGYLQNTGNDYSNQFAQYFVKYLQAYQKLGANVQYLTIQNEPLNSQAGYPTMYMFGEEQGSLIQSHVGPALASAGLKTKIWAYDHNTDNATFPKVVLERAGKYVNTVAWHCYNGPDWTVLSRFQQQNPGVQQYMTECYTPPVGHGGNWDDALQFTMGPVQNYAQGVAAWNLGSTLGSDNHDGPHLSTGGCTNCQGLVTVQGGKYTFQAAYYQMAQFSKFMPRGARVLAGTGSYTYASGAGIQSVASLNPDGSRAVVIYNNFGNGQWVSLKTSSGEQWGAIVPAKSTTTWVLPPASS